VEIIPLNLFHVKLVFLWDVVFYCDHVKSTLEKEIKQQLVPHRDKVIIITENHKTHRHMETFTKFTINDTDGMMQHIQEILKTREEENPECRYPLGKHADRRTTSL
jgi:hypothetical protein